MLRRAARRAGLSAVQVEWYDHSLPKSIGLNRLPIQLGRFTANGWVFSAVRQAVGRPAFQAEHVAAGRTGQAGMEA
jgi:hypothetical protein